MAPFYNLDGPLAHLANTLDWNLNGEYTAIVTTSWSFTVTITYDGYNQETLKLAQPYRVPMHMATPAPI